jgi:UDP-N-acetylmuramate--alanine ligase
MVFFNKVKRLHFVGIGGVGMSGIAEVLLNLGYTVTGSDLKESEITERLSSLGAKIAIGHKGENVEEVDAVVISSAIKSGNPEVEFARRRKIPVIRRAEMLAELMRLKFSVGVAGTHGKTTVTSMIGHLLTEAGLDPTIIVGGRVLSLGTNAVLGEGDFLVAEADEFDRSFLKLYPSVAVITNLEPEHLDCYRDLVELQEAFLEFANRVPFYGRVVLCLDEENLQLLVPKLERSLLSYGLVPQADLRAERLSFKENRCTFELLLGGDNLGEFSLRIPGEHNVKNALAALAVAHELGIPPERCRESLASFQGVGRRFEFKGSVNDILVYDDYAHHPTEVIATLKAARSGWNRRVVVVFQPHLYSRTRDFHQDFGKSFFNAEILIVTEIYPAREEPIPGVTAELIVEAAREFGHKQVHYLPRREEVVPFLKEILKPGDLVMTMGAGNITRLSDELVKELKR